MEQEYQKPTIGAMPKKPIPLQILDFASGGLTDPEAWAFGSDEENFMRIASLLTSILGGQAGMKSLTSAVTPSQFAKTVKADPYGLASGPMDRRVFIDRMLGHPTERAKTVFNNKWQGYENSVNAAKASDVARPNNISAWERHRDATSAAFEDAAMFSEKINAAKGWPNAVVNPEQLGKVNWVPPGVDADTIPYFLEPGPIAHFYELLKAELAKRPLP